MNNLTSNIGHIAVAVVVIAAAVVLAIFHEITGGEAIGLIASAGGFSLGGAVASSSAGVLQPSSVAVSTSPGASTLTLNGEKLVANGNGATTTPTTPAVNADPGRSL
jgi:hypothetical protein